MPDYSDIPKVNFKMFKNKYAHTDRHPADLGRIDLTRSFLEELLQRVEDGIFPVLRIAMWHCKTKAGEPYRSFCLQLEHTDLSATAASVDDDIDNDDIPF